MRDKAVVPHRAAVLAAAVLLAVACAQQQSPPDASGAPGAPGTRLEGESDSAHVARLEREARALVRTEGCGSADQCRTAPVGERACGGPRDYLVYCAATTDTVALFRKLAEQREAEIALNRKTGAVSTCEYRLPPETTLVNGVCRAQ